MLGMGQRENDAALKVAQMKPSKVEYALGMVQKSNDAAAKDVQMYPSEEECAVDTVRIAILKMNLLHLDLFSR